DSEFPPAGALASLHLGIRGFAKSEIDLAPGVPADFAAQGDVEITCHSPSVKAALQILAERHPATVPFDDLVGHIADRLPKHWSDVEELPANLVQLFGLELVDFLPRERRLSVCKSADHGPPIAVGLARWQAASGSESVVNGYHEHIDLSPLQRRILMRCDGAHGLDEIAAGITGDVLAGVLSLHLDGDEVMDAALVLEAVTLAVPQEVERLGWMGLTLRAE
ncbi:MAG: methyltransferase-like protein, partial [Myxococcota bacterium]